LSAPFYQNRSSVIARIPCLCRLGQLAVDQRFQRKHALTLFSSALQTAMRASESVGGIGVLTHPLDDTLRRFYARWSFQDLPFDPRRAMMVRMADLVQSFTD